jgi:hypothetical protein
MQTMDQGGQGRPKLNNHRDQKKWKRVEVEIVQTKSSKTKQDRKGILYLSSRDHSNSWHGNHHQARTKGRLSRLKSGQQRKGKRWRISKVLLVRDLLHGVLLNFLSYLYQGTPPVRRATRSSSLRNQSREESKEPPQSVSAHFHPRTRAKQVRGKHRR